MKGFRSSLVDLVLDIQELLHRSVSSALAIHKGRGKFVCVFRLPFLILVWGDFRGFAKTTPGEAAVVPVPVRPLVIHLDDLHPFPCVVHPPWFVEMYYQ